MERKQFLMTMAAAAAAAPGLAAAQVTYQDEKKRHPRIAAAIRELREAVLYLKAAPHDFGGHKADAIRDAEAAIGSLQLALAYREQKDSQKK